MPIYAYRCESCGHAQDVLQKISDPLLTVCPACGADAYKKQLTAAGFQLKGSGWYATDFRNSGSKPASAPAAGAAAATAATAAAAPAADSSSTGSGGSDSGSAGGAGCGSSCACH